MGTSDQNPVVAHPRLSEKENDPETVGIDQGPAIEGEDAMIQEIADVVAIKLRWIQSGNVAF